MIFFLCLLVIHPFIVGALISPQKIKSLQDVNKVILQHRRGNTIAHFPIKLQPPSRFRSSYSYTHTRSRTVISEEVVWRRPIGSRVSGSTMHSSAVSFLSPLVEEGYPPAITELSSSNNNGIDDDEYNNNEHKPLLLYLPGFDGTLVAPFLQFPELGTEFEVVGMTVAMDDRSTLLELIDYVLDHIHSIVRLKDDQYISNEELHGESNAYETEQRGDGYSDKNSNNTGDEGRPLYIMGESFGGILALEVAIAIQKQNQHSNKGVDATINIANTNTNINLQGLVLINPATSYARSQLATKGPPLTNIPTVFYPFALLTLLPLFTDSYALPQLLLMLQSKALPSIIDTPQREAYMGRTAFSLPSKLKFMPRDTLRWRLEEWLKIGCQSIAQQEEDIKASSSSLFQNLPILVVAGEVDKTLPSLSEAERLSDMLPDVAIHVVPGAGHASTSGSRVDLTALMRDRFPQLSSLKLSRAKSSPLGRRMMKEEASKGEGAYFGMVPRYDGAAIGLSPIVYWSKDNYQQV